MLQITAVHCTAADGNSAGHRASPDLQWNRQGLDDPLAGKKVGPHSWDHGNMAHSQEATKRCDDGHIVVAPRKKFPKYFEGANLWGDLVA